MNTKRILVAGLVAGFVMAVLDGITNAVIYGPAWKVAYEKLGLSSETPAIPLFWTSFDLVSGVLIAWLYAAMQPRYQPGVRTALYAAGLQWLLVHMTLFSHIADGVFPVGPLVGAGAGELVAAAIGAVIIAKLYRD